MGAYVCVNKCVCVPVPECLLSLSCSLHGTLFMSGFTYWSNSELEWLSWLERTGQESCTKTKDWSPLSWPLCFNVLWFCTRCVPSACTGFNSQHFIPQMPSLSQFVSSSSKVHSSTCMHTQKKKVAFQGLSCSCSTILFTNTIMGSWLSWHYLSRLPIFLIMLHPMERFWLRKKKPLGSVS